MGQTFSKPANPLKNRANASENVFPTSAKPFSIEDEITSYDSSLDKDRYFKKKNGKWYLAPREHNRWIDNKRYWMTEANPLWRAPRFMKQDNVWIPDPEFKQEPQTIRVNGQWVKNLMYVPQTQEIKNGKLEPYNANQVGAFVPKSSDPNKVGAFVPKSSAPTQELNPTSSAPTKELNPTSSSQDDFGLSQDEFGLSSGGSNTRSFLRKRKQGVKRTSLNKLRRSLRRKRIRYVGFSSSLPFKARSTSFASP